jgi:hypothetical protein
MYKIQFILNFLFQESPTFPVYVKFYLYHVRNPENVISGLEKPFLEEKGPYTYIEKRKKVQNLMNFTEKYFLSQLN